MYLKALWLCDKIALAIISGRRFLLYQLNIKMSFIILTADE
jgi:hypothetical protein